MPFSFRLDAALDLFPSCAVLVGGVVLDRSTQYSLQVLAAQLGHEDVFASEANRIWCETSKKSVRRATLDGSLISPAAHQATIAVAEVQRGEQEAGNLLPLAEGRSADGIVLASRVAARPLFDAGPSSSALNSSSAQRRRRSSTGKGPGRRSSAAASNAQVILEVDNVGLRLRDFDLPLFSRREKASMSENLCLSMLPSCQPAVRIN